MALLVSCKVSGWLGCGGEEGQISDPAAAVAEVGEERGWGCGVGILKAYRPGEGW